MAALLGAGTREPAWATPSPPTVTPLASVDFGRSVATSEDWDAPSAFVREPARSNAGRDIIWARRLVFVTGKGGVGKTTVASAIRLAAQATGRKTVLCRVDGHGSQPGSSAVSIDPDTALHEWLVRNAGRPAAAVMSHSNVFRYFVVATPGARELVTIGKAWDLTHSADVVVVDGPATGHAIALLQAPRTFSQLGARGPIGHQAAMVRDFLADPASSAIVVVTTPAEMPVTETLELADALGGITGRAPDLVIANEVLPDRFSAAEVRAVERVADSSSDAVLRAAAPQVQRCRRQAREQGRELRRLRHGIDAPVVELPFLFVPELGELELRALAEQLDQRRAVNDEADRTGR